MLEYGSVKTQRLEGTFFRPRKKRIGFSKRSAQWTKKGGCWISVGDRWAMYGYLVGCESEAEIGGVV